MKSHPFAILLVALLGSIGSGSRAEDCNENDLEDAFESTSEAGFPPALSLPLRELPLAVAAGDFDADANLDAAVSTVGRFVTIFFQKGGDHTFSLGRDFRGSGRSLRTADIDSDGDLDMLGVQSNLDVLYNDGSGNFTTTQRAVLLGSLVFALTDLDGDGDLDIATANFISANSVFVVLNSGDGAFSSPREFPAGEAPQHIVAGDLEGDGDQDLVVSGQGGVWMLSNTGSGDLEPQEQLLSAEIATSVVLADFDRDGDTDAVSAEYSTPRSLTLLRNDGQARFQAAATYPIAGFFLSTEDLDGENGPDLLVTGENSRASVLLNGGEGTFSEARNFTIGEVTRELTLADFDGDRDPDVLAAGKTFNLILNQGRGTFFSSENYFLDRQPLSLAPGDFDQDGHRDLAVVAGNQLQVLAGRGDGTFSPTLGITTSGNRLVAGDLNGDSRSDLLLFSTDQNQVAMLLGQGQGSFLEGPGITLEAPVAGLSLFDLEGDGDLDLVAGLPSPGKVVVLLNDGSAAFSFRTEVGLAEATIHLREGDLDGDGDPDLISASRKDSTGGTTGSVRVFLNQGPGFSPGAVFPLKGRPAGLVADDLDGDGDVDLAASDEDWASVSTFLNNGQASFEALPQLAAGNGARDLVAADLDADGRLDLAVANEFSSTLSLFLQTSAARFGRGIVTLTGERPSFLVTDDFNDDGFPDLVHLNAGMVSVALNRGYRPAIAPDCNHNLVPDECELSEKDCNSNGTLDECELPSGVDSLTFERAPPIPFVSANARSYSQAAGDLDQDGDLDLAAIPNFTSSTVSVYLNDGHGSFAEGGSYLRNSTAGWLDFADLDRDGDLDIAVAKTGQCNGDDCRDMGLATLRNGGDGRFTEEGPYPAGREPIVVVAADLTGAGYPDLAVAGLSRNPGGVTILPNRGNGTFDAVRTVSQGRGYSLAAGDFDRDGRTDLCMAGEPALVAIFNAGGGRFQAPREVEVPSAALAVAAGDLDGDQFPDLVTGNVGRAVGVFLNQRDGAFSRTTPYALASDLNYGPLSLADLDGDGDLDVASGGNAAFILQNHRGSFDRLLRLWTSGGAFQVAVGDFDGDARPDLAWGRDFGYLEVARNTSPAAGAQDCDGSGLPDECEIASGEASDCNQNGLPDHCEYGMDRGVDCNQNGIVDGCEIASGRAADCNSNARLDACDLLLDPALDCDGDGLLDSCQIASGELTDCDRNGVPDACDLSKDPALDCDRNGVPDSCDLNRDPTADSNHNQVLDACEGVPFHRGDVNQDGTVDLSDGLCTLLFLFGSGSIDSCLESADANDDGGLDCSDGIFLLSFLFLGTAPPPAPGVPPLPCGRDLAGSLGCLAYRGCR